MAEQPQYTPERDRPDPTGEVATPTAPTQAPTTKLGFLLDEQDEGKVAKYVIDRLLKPTDRADDRRAAVWYRNALWREGVRYVAVERKDTDEWVVRAPYGALQAPPSPNKADELPRRVTAQLIVDPPVPHVEPEGDTDSEVERAQLAKRVLIADGESDALNDKVVLRTAIDKGSVYGSTFSHHWIDPKGGGWRPLEVQVHPLWAQEPNAGMARFDPAQPSALLTGPDGSDSADFVSRYAKPDGSLSESASGAQMLWLPAEKEQLLTGHAVRLLPDTAHSIADADGALVLCYHEVRELKALLPKTVGTWDDAKLKKLVDWRPKKWSKRLLPKHAADPKGCESGEPVPDDALVFSVLCYYKSHGAYPKGARVWVSGANLLLDRRPWCVERPDQDGQPVDECLEVPLSQCRQLDDVLHDDPMGQGLVEFLGPPEEIRASVIGTWLAWLERSASPHLFLPIGSVVQPGQLQSRGGQDAVYYNPAGKPEWEQIPPYPSDAKEMLALMDSYMNGISGLEEAAQGVSGGDVRSGEHARQIIEQALVALSTIKQNSEDFLVRRWRIRLQLRRCFYTEPQMLRYIGDDGAYQFATWKGSDLTSSKELRIARGSYTMNAPSSKMALAREEFEIALKGNPQNPGEAYATYLERSRDGVQAITGLQDNPHQQRVRRQVDAWKQGPPEGWAEEQQAMQLQAQQAAMMQPPSVDPMSGQPIPTDPASLMPPDPANPFADVRANDEEPTIAAIRHRVLSRVLSTTLYTSQPPAWRGYLDTEYTRMRQAAGIATMAEQQQAAQQQQQMEMQAKSQQSADKDKDRQFQGAEKDKDRAAQASQQEAQLAHKAAADALRPSAGQMAA